MSLKWSSGYAADTAYTLGYYRELAPSFLDYVCAINGVSGVPWSRNLRYCELGCGRGFGTALLAAANPDMTFVGIDFSPTHIAEAKAFADRIRLPNLLFREMSFSEASRCSEQELAEFDIIAMHGVYSWVTPQIRDDIHEFIRKKLIPAGIFFVSYSTMPGWAPVGPVQRLLQEVANRSSGESLAQFSRGYEVLQTLAEKSSAFVLQNPALKNRIARMEKQSKSYLAHEFLNAGWGPLYVTDAMAMLSECKLSYVGSANIAENRIELSVPNGLQDLVRAAPDMAMRELLCDYAVNKHFRRDVYVKGPVQLSAKDRRQRLGNITFALTKMQSEMPDKLRVPAGEATLNRAMIDAILQCLGDGPVRADDLIAAGEAAGVRPVDVFRLLEVLVHNGFIYPARPDQDSLDRAPSQRLNDAVIELTSSGNTHRYLASPVLGSAISCVYVDRLLVPLVLNASHTDDQSVANEALKRLNTASVMLKRDDGPVEMDLETVAELVGDFRTERLPRWRALGLVPDAEQPEPVPAD
jgi:trans-aconitate methyltransferase